MTTRKITLMLGKSCLAIWFSLVVVAFAYSANDDGKPNVIVILADDLGYGDVEPLNDRSKISTPAFTQLAKNGMTFVDAHSPSAVCTPTRYGLICGRYPWRSPMKRGVLGGYSKPLIEEDRQTVASMMKKAGYATCCVGKWHLGLGWQWAKEPAKDINNMGIAGGKPKLVDYSKPLTYTPNNVGFDHSFIIPASLDMSPYVYIHNNRATKIPDSVIEAKKFPEFYRKGEIAEDFKIDEVLDKLTSEACKFISESAANDNPFFLYFPLSAPHKPVLPHSRFEEKTDLGPYGDFITQVDWTVGEVLRTLKDSGVLENTLLIVTSDNGSFMYRLEGEETDHAVERTVHGYNPETHQANANWRGTKADIWEAGHRVPFFVHWPAKVKGGTRSDATVCHTDMLATFAEIVGVEFDRSSAEDSFSFVAALNGEKHDRKAVIHQSGSGHLAIRDGKWKLVLGSGSGGREKPRGKPFEKPFHLYDLSSDPGETKNLFEAQPDVVNRLHNLFLEISHGDHPKPSIKKDSK